MYSYSYVPQRDIKKCSLIPLIGFILGFGFMYFANIIPYATFLQVIGIGVLAITIFLTTRFVVKSYVYSTQEIGEGDYDFVVNEISGRKSRAVLRINADEITDFIYSPDGKVPSKYAGKNGKDILRYDYCQDFMPKDAYYLYASLREGKVCIKFSPDTHLAEIIEVLRPKNFSSSDGDA